MQLLAARRDPALQLVSLQRMDRRRERNHTTKNKCTPSTSMDYDCFGLLRSKDNSKEDQSEQAADQDAGKSSDRRICTSLPAVVNLSLQKEMQLLLSNQFTWQTARLGFTLLPKCS
jgi:hypothetical protein